MAQSSADSNPVTRRSRPRRLALQACDTCRRQKSRCDVGQYEVMGDHTSHSPFLRSSLSCRRCAVLEIPCTYLDPVKSRGPQKKALPPTTRRVISPPAAQYLQSPCAVSPGLKSCIPSPTSINLSNRERSLETGNPLTPSIRSQKSPVDASCCPSQHSATHPSLSDIHVRTVALGDRFLTDSLCSRSLFRMMLNDYLDLLYPLVPVVHRPSFRRDITLDRDQFDPEFLGLTVALIAALVATIPRKFEEYRSCATPIRFESRSKMINFCYDMVLALRGEDYFDRISILKWATCFNLSIAYFQIGLPNRGRVLDVESMLIARLLNLHDFTSYIGLDCIESQLRKKAFWLEFYGLVHCRVAQIMRERMSYLDETTLNTLNLSDLMPWEVDDEMILKDKVLPQPAELTCLTTGFVICSRVFWASLSSAAIEKRADSKSLEEHCECVRSSQSAIQLAHLRQRLHDVKYILNEVPSHFKQWSTSCSMISWHPSFENSEQIQKIQFESMRANIHVTQLWLQSVLLERIETLRAARTNEIPQHEQLTEQRSAWNEREDICRQLLHVLYSISPTYLEPNGNNITYKVRDVAVSLLSCPFDKDDSVSRKAREYLQEFTAILSRLDGSSAGQTINSQSWVDAGREPREP